MNCPNCGTPVADHPENGCVLAALIQVIRDRGNMSEQILLALHAGTDVDLLWESVGAIVDNLEMGTYSNE
jgi:hypothetical protein